MDNWIFWAVAGCLSVAVVALLARSLFVAGAAAPSPNVRIYRDQLEEVDRDLARGTMAPDEADRARLEVSRRLLEADRRTVRATGRGSVVAGALLVILTAAGVGLLYLRLGAPGYPDLPHAVRLAALEAARSARPTQAEAERQAPPVQAETPDPKFAALVGQLRAAVQRNPQDLRGQQLLARNEAALGNFPAAVEAQRQVLALKAEPSAADHAALAELMIYAAGGYVSPEAEAVLTQSLRRDPKQPLALYLSGVTMAQGGRDDLAFRDWTRALDVAAPDAPWRATVLAAMPEIAARAGERWTPPEALPGPDAGGVAALQALPEADRNAAIAGMVDGLATRLKTTGGSAAEWARLINAYNVLGRADEAQTAAAKAAPLFTGEERAVIERAARSAGAAP
ncbi:c-type cytochrome biogenesis protein CcmI [Falsirhodobacter sp. 20TX0035]|uniref:c-type cytochrome biogenesis protein CcmI n=1 Tax=Falsirhodobacter sp. 20TX0035 TaxID=3022019 RepID=UPI002330EFA1|nr:c-type cytochrome biogenesis protein CcmI [Falsirhodobacter sp. 20TX0035]MDB6454829.1 c-type cytochrome biogenesis protein CcmI [Falsirhodobacter sp. 20TX0035]